MPVNFIRIIDRKRWTLLSIIIVVPVGFLTKCYSGPGSDWVNNSLGGVLYILFWSLAFSLIFGKARAWKIVLTVLLATSGIEILQLWHPNFLEEIRSTFIGVTLLGNSFSWLDMLHYVIGSLLSWVVLHLLSGNQVRRFRIGDFFG